MTNTFTYTATMTDEITALMETALATTSTKVHDIVADRMREIATIDQVYAAATMVTGEHGAVGRERTIDRLRALTCQRGSVREIQRMVDLVGDDEAGSAGETASILACMNYARTK